MSFSIFVFSKGLVNGTELVGLAFLQLILSSIIEGKIFGHYLGLLMLNRYNAFRLVILSLWSKSLKQATINIGLAMIFMLPWLLYNYAKYGNLFASIADQYANNIFFRDYLWSAPKFEHFLEVFGILLPFALLGLIIHLKEIWQKRNWKSASVLVFLIAIITIFDYWQIPLKSSRYLFNLALPIAVWSYDGLNKFLALIKRKTTIKKEKLLPIIALCLFAISVFSSLPFETDAGVRATYEEALSELDKNNLSKCRISSNAFVELSYLGKVTSDFPRKELLNKTIQSGEIVVLFRNSAEPDYVHDKEFLSQFPAIKRTKMFDILGTGCNPERRNDELFVKKLADTIEQMQGYRTEERPCHLLFKDVLLQKACSEINSILHTAKKEQVMLV